MAFSPDKINPAIVIPVVSVLFVFVAIYLGKYVLPYRRLTRELKKILAGIASCRQIGDYRHDPDLLTAKFQAEPYRHLWAEYRDTLHAVMTPTGSLDAIRATVPAEVYFTPTALVDNPMSTDFFRHLPGILTGIGIIGTFSGLVYGLHNFDTNNPGETLKGLLDEVTSAFLGSALAILFAIVITAHEKYAVNRGYQLVERLTHAIDALYETGAGERYLARLVDATEKSSLSAASLKDALIEDLGTLMNTVAARQIAAQEHQSLALAGQISAAITTGLSGPMNDLKAVVERASGHQGEAVSGILERLLTGFMAKLDDTFGQQIQGINLAMQQSSAVMAQVQGALTGLVTDIAKASVDTTDHMSAKLDEAMNRAAAAQETMNERLRTFIEELRQTLSSQQDAVRATTAETSQSVIGMLQNSLALLQDQRTAQASQDQVQRDQQTAVTDRLLEGLSGNVQQVLADLNGAATRNEATVTQLQQTVQVAADRLGDGAGLIRAAAEAMAQAGQGMTGTLEQTRTVAGDMKAASQTIATATAALQQGFTQYDQARGATQAFVLQLEALVGTAKQEAGVSQQLVRDIERASQALAETERLSEAHLQAINTALSTAFEAFGKEMVGQVSQMSRQSQQHMSDATASLEGIVTSMAQTVARMRHAS